MGGSCDLLEVLQKALVLGVMYVAVEHPHMGIPVLIPPVLAVVAEDGIVTEDDLPASVAKLRVGPDPFEAGGVEVLRFSEAVVVA